MNQVIISFGSNIEPKKNLASARKQIEKRYGLLKESQFVDTVPIGNVNQANFKNGVFLIETQLSQDALKQELKEIEFLLGRNPASTRHSPRTVDLDIIVWNNEIIDDDIYKRDFLRDATLEVAPSLVIPPQADERRQEQ